MAPSAIAQKPQQDTIVSLGLLLVIVLIIALLGGFSGLSAAMDSALVTGASESSAL